MTNKDSQDAAARRAARELVLPIRRQLERAERTIRSLTEKLEHAEKVNIELRRENARLTNEIMR